MRYSNERKQAVLAKLSPPYSRPIAEIAAEEGISQGTLYNWRKHMALHRGTVPTARGRYERLSMDFVHDQMLDGRPFRILTVVDQWSRESVIVEPRMRYRGQDVVAALREWTRRHGTPATITVDHGTELTSKALECWAWENGIELDFIHPGKPTENGYIESFNGRLRDECLNVNQFLSLEHARQIIGQWRDDYNHHRPHSSLGYLTPLEFVGQHDDNRTPEPLNPS